MNAPDQARRDELVRTYLESQLLLGDLRVARRLRSIVRTQLTAQQFRAIAILLLDGEISAHELARSLGVSPATVSGILDRLEAARLVERRTDARDGRIRRIVVTENGASAVRGIVVDDEIADQDLVSTLSTEDLDHLSRGVAALARAAEATSAVGTEDACASSVPTLARAL
ncbi:MarR family winged helix-turn-helix transcriptional regulator [Sediminihabitans luteus]|uniref:MarR family winged helix-turn-helix transcriptional regulator n=1 Tax=Sediminihabitans luteus TaxID=1138585 RepID=UPI0012FD35A6|nr:MarR family transcriptional regulator [Sediminihabitans luteus]